MVADLAHIWTAAYLRRLVFWAVLTWLVTDYHWFEFIGG